MSTNDRLGPDERGKGRIYLKTFNSVEKIKFTTKEVSNNGRKGNKTCCSGGFEKTFGILTSYKFVRL